MKKKISVLLGLCAVSLVAFGAGMASLKEVKAEDTATFETNGAGVMISSPTDAKKNGIRFNVVLEKDSYDAMATSEKAFKTGVLVLPADLVTQDFTLENYGNGESKCENKDTTALWENEGKMAKNTNGIYEPTTDENAEEFMSTYVYLYNIEEANYNRGISFVGYYIYDNGTPVYTNVMTRSISYVANEIITNNLEPDNQATLEKYLLDYEVAFGDVETKTVKYGQKVAGELPVAVEEGKEFAGWYMDEALTTPFDKDLVIRGNLTLYAGWKETVALATTQYEKYSSLNGDDRVANTNDLTVDLSSVVSETAAKGTLKFVKDAEETVVENFNVSGTTISIQASDIPVGEGKFVYSTTEAIVEIPVLVVNKIITTDSDLLNWYKYGEYTKTEWYNNASFPDRWYTLDGYFTLGQNISLDTTIVAPFANATSLIRCGNQTASTEANKYDGTVYGFIGTFDGCGYTIKGGQYGNGGLFGQIGEAGVVKNLAFKAKELKPTNTKENAQVVAAVVCGKLENVLVDIETVTRNEGLVNAVALYIAGASLTNVVVYYPGTKATEYCAPICGAVYTKFWQAETVVFTNVVIVSADTGTFVGYDKVGGGAEADAPKNATQYSDNTTCAQITWDEAFTAEDSIWDLTGDRAAFKKANEN